MIWDGDIIEHEGHEYAVNVLPDECSVLIAWDRDRTIGTSDCEGDFAWKRPDDGRPRSFTGLARVLQSNGGDPLWWMPPEDMRSAKAWGGGDTAAWLAALDSMAADIVRTLGEGYIGIVVARLDDGHEVDSESLWGIEAWGYEYHEDVARGLIDELARRIPVPPMTMLYGSALVTA